MRSKIITFLILAMAFLMPFFMVIVSLRLHQIQQQLNFFMELAKEQGKLNEQYTEMHTLEAKAIIQLKEQK